MPLIDINQLPSEMVQPMRSEVFVPKFSTEASVDNDIANVETILAMSDQDLTSYVSKYLSSLLDALYSRKNKAAMDLLSNERVLQILSNLANKLPLSITDLCNLNRMVYDGLGASTLQSKKVYFLNVGRSWNSILYSRLISCVADEVAVRLCVARNSSIDALLSMKRMSRVMHLCSSDIMTEQTIVYVFGHTFDSATKIFEGVMFDVIDDFTNKNAEEVYCTISLAALDVVESMPFDYIKQTLKMYYNDIAYLGVPRTRFDLSTVNAVDYPRIRQAFMDITGAKPVV